MDNTQSTLYTDSGIILQNSDSVLPTNLVVSDASGKRTSVTIEGDLYVAGEIKAGETNSDFDSDNSRLPSQDGNAGKFLETNGTSVFWDTVNQVPIPSAANQILNSTGAGTYTFTDNPTIDIIRTGSGSSSGLRIGTSNTGVYGLSSSNVMGIITGNAARQTWDSNGSNVSVPLTVSNGLCLSFTSQATNRTLSQTDTTFQRINYTNNNVTYTLPPLANGTQFWLNPHSNNTTYTCTLTTNSTSTSMETYYDGVRSVIPNTGSGTIPAAVNITMGYIYQCVYFASLTTWLIIRTGTDKNGVIGNLTVTSNLIVQGTGTSSIAGQLNLTTAGSATAPTLLLGDSTVPQSGIWGTDGSIRIGTDGVERVNIGTNTITFTLPTTSESSFIASRGVGGTNGFRFSGLNDSGIRGNLSTNEVFLRSNGNNIISVLNASGTSTATVTGAFNVTGDSTITGDLSVSGTISGNISAPPQVARRVQIVAPDDSNPVVYDSTNPNPPTTVISTSITSNKLVTLGDLGAAYDGFEMEYSLQGVGNTFGVWFTFVAPRGILFPRENRVRISNTGANTSTNSFGTGYFNKCTNNFRARATFVWAGDANNCYWIVRDITDYTQRLSTLNLNTGALTISKDTARHVLVRRNVATTITFPNLSTVGQNPHDADGFEVRIVAYRVAGDTPNTVTIENTSGTTMFFITSNTTTEIANNGTQQFVSSTGSAQMDCVYRLDNASNYCWIITKYAG
jgi:hypothetical protein